MDIPGIVIKKIKESEIAVFKELAWRTFYETFQGTTSEENLIKYLEESFNEEQLRSELQIPGSYLFFAWTGREVAGYLKVNTGNAQGEFKGKNTAELERLYVLKEFQGTGVGQMLFEKAVDIAIEKNAELLWLGVWEKNDRAIRFYEKNGFVQAGEHLFMVGEDRQTDLLMERVIK